MASKGKKRNAKDQVENKKNSKKVPMKTAKDVIDRIHWDADIPESDMFIGYIDRFLGIIEKPFDAFCWDPLDSIDYYTFGIPKHRIQYFKYKKVIVWDKRCRLDNVFGSTGSSLTIKDVINMYDDNLNYEPPQINGNEYGSDDDNEDENDDIDILFDQNAVPDLKINNEVNDDNDDENNTQDYWKDKLRPNFFICQRIKNQEIQEIAKKVQDHIVGQEPLYESCCHPAERLHVTLCTLRLDDAIQVAECMLALKEAYQELQDLLPKKELQISGVDRFFGRVLYAKIEHTDELITFVDHLRLVLQSKGFQIVDNFDFVAHISLLKVTRPVSRKLGNKNINPRLFSDFENTYFGKISLETLYLCSMEKSRDGDGFYTNSGYLTFNKSILTAAEKEGVITVT